MECEFLKHSNTNQQIGEYVCCNCGTHIELDNAAILPPCPTCGNNTFIAHQFEPITSLH